MSFLLPQLNDVIDIALLSIIIYYIILLLSKKAGGVSLIFGALIAIVIYFVSSFFELSLINSIFRSLKNYWLIIFVIIFQKELKNALIKFGQRGGFKRLLKENKKSYYHTLINTVSVLAFRKIGALIVIERNNKLTDYISSGEIIDADISNKLILTIFNKNTILHDGALVIRKNRIYAVKVVLPLSQNVEYVKQLGTRHLAAVGLSESTDAVVIVVSEETGKISFAINGNLFRGLSVEELRQRVIDATKEQ